ncbi:MAG: S1 RNA-binding domain-containing protein [Candidatus Marsarchaeota archaeon]|jgi:translation initiation factor 2 alpha subunit (eIF-2alpha)|nr:S1 RNA-binding domain-containing protein [Candidatus Marsarchaeota archaeon]MCL5111716.1 S1 RNA-binding domain-containing protein [Candidatus Marsarchaeota archaeon]
MADNETPRIGTLVIAQVSKITQFGAYCKLPEYGNIEVFLPIREVSSGWIKNIREFIHEGQSLVCKVATYDKNRNTIDVSLKKVTPKETKVKIGAYNLEKRLSVLLQRAAKQAGVNDKETTPELLAKFGSYASLFQHASENTEQFSSLKIPKSFKDEIRKAIEANRKEKKHTVSYIATISTYNTESGVTELRKLLGDARADGVEVSYISAPKYRFVSDGKDYVEAEAKIKKAEADISAKIKKGTFKLEKEKLRKEKEDILAQI